MSDLREYFELAARAGLEEDLGERGLAGDVTSFATIPANAVGEAILVAKADGVLAGLEALDATFALLDPGVSIALESADGETIAPGRTLARVTGPARVLLTGERTALNVLTHLSGIATVVRSYVREARGVELTDIRKTLPGLRALQKYAVRCGGGRNHRMALWDAVLIKDNHVVAAGGVFAAVRRAKDATSMAVEVECGSLDEVHDALDAGADSILLDNFTPPDTKTAVELIRSVRPETFVEASGGITLASVAQIAACGVDRISVGALTHSAPALDMSFELVRTWTGPERED